MRRHLLAWYLAARDGFSPVPSLGIRVRIEGINKALILEIQIESASRMDYRIRLVLREVAMSTMRATARHGAAPQLTFVEGRRHRCICKILLSSMGKKILILGGSGFLGINLTAGLLAGGNDVVTFGRPPARYVAALALRHIAGSLEDTVALRTALGGVEIVYHLSAAGTPSSVLADPVRSLRDSVGATLNLLELCGQAGISRIIFTSSGGTVYGIPRTNPISEDHPTAPISSYGVQKLAIEKYLAVYARTHGFDYKIARISNPFGPHQLGFGDQGLVAQAITRILNGLHIEIWGDGNVMRDFVYVDDVVDALCRLAEYQGPRNVFNVGSGEGRSVIDVCRAVAMRMIGNTGKIRFLPGRTIDVPINVLDIGLALGELDWRPTVDWGEGLEQTISWHREFSEIREEIK